MTTIHLDDRDTIHVAGTLTELGTVDLKRTVNDAFRRGRPLESLTLDFSGLVAIEPAALEPLRAAMSDLVSICTERDTALRVVTGPAMRDLAH